jgi:hypothetical protein
MGAFESGINRTTLRNVAGQFVAVSNLSRRLQEREAAAFKVQLANTITRKIINKKWSTGDLAKAHGAKGNSTVTDSAFFVGQVAWLDKAAARDRGFTYWKMIEYGSTKNVGRSIKVAIGGTRFSLPRSTSYRSFRTGEPRAAFGTTRGVRWRRVIISKPMIAQNAYRETYEKGQWLERSRREFEKILSGRMRALVSANQTPV